MLRSALSALIHALPATAVEAHCDGPCGVYDPASARVAAEAVLSMTKKLKAMEAPAGGDAAALAATTTPSAATWPSRRKRLRRPRRNC